MLSLGIDFAVAFLIGVAFQHDPWLALAALVFAVLVRAPRIMNAILPNLFSYLPESTPAGSVSPVQILESYRNYITRVKLDSEHTIHPPTDHQ